MKRKGARIPSETQMISVQDAVIMRYKKMGAIRNDNEARDLHQFFGPNIVPQGMTKDEARQCLAAYPLRDWHRNRWGSNTNSLIGLALGRPLPNEFKVFGRKITRTEFKIGMNKFKAEIITLLLSDISEIQIAGDNKSGDTIAEQLISRMAPFMISAEEAFDEAVKNSPRYKVLVRSLNRKKTKRAKVPVHVKVPDYAKP